MKNKIFKIHIYNGHNTIIYCDYYSIEGSTISCVINFKEDEKEDFLFDLLIIGRSFDVTFEIINNQFIVNFDINLIKGLNC